IASIDVPLRNNSRLLSFESQRRRVDAIPQAGRARAVVEHVSQMRAAVRAFHFGPPHEQIAILLLPDALFPERLPEARPSRPGIEFGLRCEKFLATDDAPIDPVIVVVPVLTGKGPLRPLVHGDLVLDRRQALPQTRLVKLVHVELPPLEPFKVSDPSDCASLGRTALSSSSESGGAADFMHESRLEVGTWRPNENQTSAPKRTSGRRSRRARPATTAPRRPSGSTSPPSKSRKSSAWSAAKRTGPSRKANC